MMYHQNYGSHNTNRCSNSSELEGIALSHLNKLVLQTAIPHTHANIQVQYTNLYLHSLNSNFQLLKVSWIWVQLSIVLHVKVRWQPLSYLQNRLCWSVYLPLTWSHIILFHLKNMNEYWILPYLSYGCEQHLIMKPMTSPTEIAAFLCKWCYAADVRATCIALTQDCWLPKCSVASDGKGERAEHGQNAECNHSSTSEQQSDRSTQCKPSGLVIIVWTQKRPVWCQGALQHSHCQFMNTRFVSEHIKTWASNFLCDLTAAISHQPQSYNLFFYILTCAHTHTPLDMLMAPNWPHHYGHIKFKLAPNDIEIIF